MEITALLYLNQSYKTFLQEVEEQRLIVKKGFRAQLAAAANCNTTFVSHVLNSHAHFSHEQIWGIALYMGLSNEDADYFLLLLQYERAGTSPLREHLHKKILGLQSQQQVLRKRLKSSEALTLEQKVRYYSSWEYAAVHVIVTIGAYGEVDKITERLQIPAARVRKILQQLIDMNLIEQTAQSYRTTNKQIFLGADSDLINNHHANWRTRTLQALTQSRDEDLHYSSVITISRRDAKLLRRELVDLLSKVTPLINGSKEEEIYSFCLDLFSL